MDETTPTTTEGGSNKNMLYIGLGVLALIILGFIFMGRGGGIAAIAPDGVDVDSNLDGTRTYTNDDGSVTVGEGASMPDNWPSDAPVAYTGATIVYSGSTNPTTGESGSAVSYTTSASVQSVVEYYTARLKAEGWTIDGTANMQGMNVVSAKKDTRVFGAYIVDGGSGMTTVTAGVQL